ncbi:MAG TPA: tautomerase family protein [Solirubrobacteraceae bacterium]|nr:tautomerase family protein [Solirubrobacteraceae bacterium]
MPIMDVTYPRGALSDDARDELIEELTTVLLRAERAPDTEFFRGVTWVFVHELPEGHVYTAGRPAEAPIFRIDTTTPQGALSDRRRAELVENATDAVKRAAGVPDDELLRIFVLCHEVDEGSWGAAGQVVRFAALRETAAAERAKAEA